MTKTLEVPALEAVCAAAGVDVSKAKSALAVLDAKFGGQHGDIPEGALRDWVAAHFGGSWHPFFMEIGRTWERELAAGLPEDRKAERKLSAAEWAKRRDAKK